MSIRKGMVEESVKLLQAKGYEMTSERIAEVDLMSYEIPSALPFTTMVEMLVNIYKAKWLADDQHEFITLLNMYLSQRNRLLLTDQEVQAVLAYQTSFELTGQNVWDGTCYEHYGKWVIKQREPRTSSQQFFNDRVCNHLESMLIRAGYQMLMRNRVDDLIDIYDVAEKNPTPLMVAADIFKHIEVRIGTENDEYKLVCMEASKDAEELNNSIQFKQGTSAMKTFTSFSGADAMMVINGVIVGEAQQIRWCQILKRPFPDGYPVQGFIDFTMFDREPIKDLIKRDRTTIGIIFANEYGQRAFTKIVNPEFTRMEGGVSVDQIVGECRYYFVADDVEMLEHDGPIHLDNGELNPVFDR